MQTHHWPAQQRVHAGVGALAALPKELDAFGWQRPLLITTNSLIRSGMAERVRALLGDRCAGMVADIPAHSPLESVARLVAKFGETRADGVVALGGGSVIDATKGMLVALGAGLQASDITGKALTGASGGGTSAWGTDFSRPRMIAVPTTLSAAEFTSFGGVTDTAAGRKLMVGHPLAVPVVVIQDPSCTLDTPAELLLSTGARSVDHSVEGFCAPNASPISDATAIEAARRMWSALPRMHADPTDLAARSDAQAAAWLSIQGRSGGVSHGASHGIGYLLGGSAGATMALLKERGVERISVYSSSGRAAEFTGKRGGFPLSDELLPQALREAGLALQRWVHDGFILENHVASWFAAYGP